MHEGRGMRRQRQLSDSNRRLLLSLSTESRNALLTFSCRYSRNATDAASSTRKRATAGSRAGAKPKPRAERETTAAADNEKKIL